MITPKFSLSQTDEHLIVEINVPYVRVSDMDFTIDGFSFSFYCKPYLLKLRLTGRVLDSKTSKESKAVYDVEKENGTVTIYLLKETRGEHFEDLDLLTKVLQPKLEKAEKLKKNFGIEVISSETFDADEALENDEITVSELGKAGIIESDDIKLGISAPSYGFNFRYSNFFKDIQHEFELVDLPSPDQIPNTQRKALRIAAEDGQFDANRYIGDFLEGEEDPLYLMAVEYTPFWISCNSLHREQRTADSLAFKFDTQLNLSQSSNNSSNGLNQSPFAKKKSVNKNRKRLSRPRNKNLKPDTRNSVNTTFAIESPSSPASFVVDEKSLLKEPTSTFDEVDKSSVTSNPFVFGDSSKETMSVHPSVEAKPDSNNFVFGSSSKETMPEQPSIEFESKPDSNDFVFGSSSEKTKTKPEQASVEFEFKPDIDNLFGNSTKADQSDPFLGKMSNLNKNLGSSSNIVFSAKENEQLTKLPNKEYLISTHEQKQLLLLALDVILSFVFDHRMTEGEGNVESAWTVRTLSANLCWLDGSASSVEETMLCYAERALCYPYLRNVKFIQLTWKDASKIFQNGKRCVLKCLLRVHELFEHSEIYYLLNKLFITDLSVWIQTVDDRAILAIADEIDSFIASFSKSKLRFGVVKHENEATAIQ